MNTSNLQQFALMQQLTLNEQQLDMADIIFTAIANDDKTVYLPYGRPYGLLQQGTTTLMIVFLLYMYHLNNKVKTCYAAYTCNSADRNRRNADRLLNINTNSCIDYKSLLPIDAFRGISYDFICLDNFFSADLQTQTKLTDIIGACSNTFTIMC